MYSQGLFRENPDRHPGSFVPQSCNLIGAGPTNFRTTVGALTVRGPERTHRFACVQDLSCALTGVRGYGLTDGDEVRGGAGQAQRSVMESAERARHCLAAFLRSPEAANAVHSCPRSMIQVELLPAPRVKQSQWPSDPNAVKAWQRRGERSATR